MKAIRGSFLAAGIVALLFVVGTGPAACEVTPSQAEAVADAVLQRHLTWQLGGSSFEFRRSVIILFAPEANVFVDASTGVMTHYASHPGLSKATPDASAIGADQALANAQAFLARVGIPLQEWTVRSLKHFDHGTGGQEYEIEWSLYYYGVEMPAYLTVDIDALTGDVDDYIMVDDPLTIPIQPHVTVEQAAAAVARRMGFTHPVVDRAELSAWYTSDHPGPERLFWSFENMREAGTPPESRNRAMMAEVDAVTGEFVGAGIPMSMQRRQPGSKTGHNPGSKPKPPQKPAPVVIAHLQANLPVPPKAKPPLTVFQEVKLKTTGVGANPTRAGASGGKTSAPHGNTSY